MEFAKRLDAVPPYLFVEISRKIAAKKAQGINVISFGIGDPDIPTPSVVIEELRSTSLDSVNHRYPETDGLPEFRSAVSGWYKRRFNVDLDSDKEIIPLIGAKEGIGHAAFCFINPGDVALVPDPGYPVYSVGTWFAGGECHWMPLKEENGWLPDLGSIPGDILKRAKVMWLNYPNNPTGAVVDEGYFKEVIAFAKQHNIVVLHDACYTEVAYDGYKPISFLQIPGAMDVGVEFHSLSKSYNMTGWRVGVAAGNKDMIDALMIVKSNLDSGIPNAVQYMGIEALKSTDQEIRNRNDIYQSRRDKVVTALKKIGLDVEPPKASLYVWAKIPSGYKSAEFAELILEETNVVVTAGNGYGPSGEGYIRLSLTIGEDDLDEGIKRLQGLKIPELK
ncbi:MAG: aminotransferase class I/II-fold pyridoxal phosphate-dependent enzyme [SAR202 cluster bacterium]|nr:LL-diaminopimelate aminotransferase [Chloroflexota bacterium]MQG22283.1 aminotransferase class I/II-fold pyridoxal phosphate-dependent enzyme [SAR202 cluster bacterium]|tara:strand:- start:2309 stop:3481 length:1173 start_codon:yes stop_codon:yes gene_type:complete